MGYIRESKDYAIDRAHSARMATLEAEQKKIRFETEKAAEMAAHIKALKEGLVKDGHCPILRSFGSDRSPKPRTLLGLNAPVEFDSCDFAADGQHDKEVVLDAMKNSSGQARSYFKDLLARNPRKREEAERALAYLIKLYKEEGKDALLEEVELFNLDF